MKKKNFLFLIGLPFFLLLFISFDRLGPKPGAYLHKLCQPIRALPTYTPYVQVEQPAVSAATAQPGAKDSPDDSISEDQGSQQIAEYFLAIFQQKTGFLDNGYHIESYFTGRKLGGR